MIKKLTVLVPWILYCVEVLLLAQFIDGMSYDGIHPNDFGYDGDSTFTQYIFHTEKLKWNEAKQVCENNGGTLAKVETLTRYTAIKDVAKSLYDLNIFAASEFYLAIVRSADDEYIWTSDCSLLQENDTFVQNTNKECVLINRDEFTANDIYCDYSHSFLCQQTTDIPCSENVILDNNAQFFTETNTSACSYLCQHDIHCWSYISYPIGICVKIMLNDYGNYTLQMAVKQCINVTLNTTTPNNYNNDDSYTAKHDCIPPYNNHLPHVLLTPTVSQSEYPTLLPCLAPPTLTVTVLNTVLAETTLLQPTSVMLPTTVILTTTDILTTTIIVPTSYTDVFTYVHTVTETLSLETNDPLTSEEIMEAELKAAVMVTNLTVDAKTTSSHIRKLTSAEDNRSSASFVGTVGVIFVVIPLVVIFITDLSRAHTVVKNYWTNTCTKWKKRGAN